MRLRTLAQVLNQEFGGCRCDADVRAKITKSGSLRVTIGKHTRTLTRGRGLNTIRLADWFDGFRGKTRVHASGGFNLSIGNRDVSLDDSGNCHGAGTAL
jgi:hypothetical protein